MIKQRSRLMDLEEKSTIMYSQSNYGFEYRVEASWYILDNDPSMCSFQIFASNTQNRSYVTSLNLILSSLGLTGEEPFVDGSHMILSKRKANKFLNKITSCMGDPMWRKQLVKELDEDYKEGWEH